MLNPDPVVEDETAAAVEPDSDSDEALIAEDLIVEDVSIDGMCGVY
jgi:mycofactocin precursor